MTAASKHTDSTKNVLKPCVDRQSIIISRRDLTEFVASYTCQSFTLNSIVHSQVYTFHTNLQHKNNLDPNNLRHTATQGSCNLTVSCVPHAMHAVSFHHSWAKDSCLSIALLLYEAIHISVIIKLPEVDSFNVPCFMGRKPQISHFHFHISLSAEQAAKFEFRL